MMQTASRLGSIGESAVNIARQAIEIVVGVLLVDRELVGGEYEDLFHLNW